MALGLVPLCGACDLETSGNGDLDGMWFLASVDTIATLGRKDMADERMFWSFQHKLLQFDDKKGTHASVLLRFEHKNGNLKLYDPYIYDRENGDKLLTDSTVLHHYGMQNLEENFVVESLGGDKMVLRSATLRLRLRKI